MVDYDFSFEEPINHSSVAGNNLITGGNLNHFSNYEDDDLIANNQDMALNNHH